MAGKLKIFSVMIPEEVHRRLRLLAAMENKPMADIARDAIAFAVETLEEDYFDSHGRTVASQAAMHVKASTAPRRGRPPKAADEDLAAGGADR